MIKSQTQVNLTLPRPQKVYRKVYLRMVMCSRCHKRMAVVFVTKIENGEKISEGICMKCAKELGLPVENMLGNVFDNSE